MSFEKPLISKESSKESPETNKKEIFLRALDEELAAMEQAGKISPEQAEKKSKAAELIETGLHDDPERDAQLFANTGIAGEEEMAGLIKGRSKGPEGEITPEEENRKERFLRVLNDELTVMEQAGKISPEQAEKKSKAAELIETGLHDDPERDAQLFANAGIVGEEEMIKILTKKEITRKGE